MACAGLQRLRCAQEMDQRIFRVGIIDHNGKVLPGFNPLESSRNIAHRMDTFADHIG